ncbi:phage holin, LLH family [Apilactobacillus quenuiae]|uniref:phage holin, LLH family n=1 Tax=Apilactobacillus quenuiae TaxID=2008377 RepID=UPI000D01DE60|nr:phage holin, LLH family [Apilactobacillus quenuiae]
MDQLLNWLVGLITSGTAATILVKALPIIKGKHRMQNLQFAEKLAYAIVVPLAQRADLTNNQKLQSAIRLLTKKLSNIGISLPESTINGVIEKVYQNYKNSGGDVHKFINDTLDDADKQIVTIHKD